MKHSDLYNFESFDAIVDGYILNAPYKNNPTTQRALSKGLPTVVVDFDAPAHTSVLTNDFSVMSEITEHLLSLGHQQLGIITFPVKEGSHDLFALDKEMDIDNYVAKQRMLGCKEAIAKSEIELDSILICEASNSEDGGAEAARRLLERQPDITALICFSDRLAYGAMTECKRLRLDVPQRLSVTGFDDIEPRSLHATLPALTTVRQNAYEKGRKAAEALLHDGGEQGRRINIEATVIKRDSTAQIKAV